MSLRGYGAPGRDGDPSVAVVVTNWNYGHFLAGCLDGVLAQTVAPDEIIVVDDGSTDGSIALLADYADRVHVVEQRNGGQASAFNAGFARSTSDLVLFLDADDLLRPEAIETILTWWRPDLSSLSFWLELIDVGGRSRGLYEETLRIDEGDKRQRLIARGVFAFAPTSGNVFSRAFLDGFFPLDEARWRISADLPLTYAAALHGPNVVIPQALGAYRTHGTNNYYRERLPDAWRLHRGMRDVVDALALLAERQHGRRGPGGDEALLELALRSMSLRMRVKLQTLQGNRGDLGRHARHHLGEVLASSLPLPLRLASAAVFAFVGCGGWRWPWVRRWIADPRTRPAVLHGIAEFLCGTHPEGVLARYARLQNPRWSALLPFGVTHGPDFNGLAASLMAEGWSGEMNRTLHWSRGSRATLAFRLDPHPHAVRLELSLVLCPALKGVTVAVKTTIEGRDLTVDHLTDRGVLVVDLSREMLEASPQIRLQLDCAIVSPRPSIWRALVAPAPNFAIRWLRATALDLPPPHPLLAAGISHPFGDLLAPQDADPEWQVDPDGVGWMSHSEATCRVTVAPFENNLALHIALAASEAQGWLRITCGDRPLFSGLVVSGADLHCALAPIENPDASGLDLAFAFTANDPTDAAKLGIAAIGLVTLGEATASAAARPAQPLGLNIGERVDLDLEPGKAFAAGRGWEFDETTGVGNVEPQASFTLRVPPDCRDPVLHLSLEPLLPEPDDHHHVIAVSIAHDVLVSARLQGAGTLGVPLSPDQIGRDGALTMTLHSIFVASAATPGEIALPLFAGVKLRAVSLSGRPSASHLGRAVAMHRHGGSALHDLAVAAREAVDGERPRHDLPDMRRRLATAIWRTDGRGIESQLMVPGFLEDLASLGALAAPIPLDAVEAALAAAVESSSPGPGVLSRQMLCSMVLGTSPVVPALVDLGGLPAPLLWFPRPLARHLAGARHGHRRDFADPGRDTAHERVLRNVLAALRHEPRRSVRYRLAVEILELWDAGVDAPSDPLQRLWARAVELHLSRSGCALAARMPPRRAGRRLRVGLLVRDTAPGPDMGLALGIGGALDRSRFEPIAIVLGGAGDPRDLDMMGESAVVLKDATVEACIARVRQLDLDLLLVTATLRVMDTMAAVAAHRLAPVQVVLSKSPVMGTRLRSVGHGSGSHARRSSDREPGSKAREILPLACLDALAHAAERREVAVRENEPSRPGAVVLHGSAADVEDCWLLAELWVRILAACPESRLVVTAAPGPLGDGANARLLPGLFGGWCLEHGVARSRVTFSDRAAVDADGNAGDEPDLHLGSLMRHAGPLLAAIEAGIPCVALGVPGAEVWAACLAQAGLIANAPEAYVRSAVALVGDPADRDRRRADLAEALTRPRLEIAPDIRHAVNEALLGFVTDPARLEESRATRVGDGSPNPGL